MNKRMPPGAQAAAASHARDKRFGGNCALTGKHKLPVPETDEPQVVEPDGTEDPGASADDGLMSGQGKN
ncbi:hypothetical protein ACIPEN_12030 [Herbaspirillum chlorophenolicum]|uniref:Uncharacterized protein n=1 Tax=Herbaspirillum chlorophenolicum TaxID=211589 RepID=A0ABW8EZV6_9BURK